jgi:hypothetical protein
MADEISPGSCQGIPIPAIDIDGLRRAQVF